MTIESVIDVERRLVLTYTTGRVDDADLVKHEMWIGEQSGFEPSFSQLADARGVTENLVTPAGLISIANITPFAATARRCYVVSSELSKGFSNLFGFRSSESPEYFMITEDIKAAEAWIDSFS